MEPQREHAISDSHRQLLAGQLRGVTCWNEIERLRTEMVEQLAPAGEGPILNPGRPRRGRLVFGDATE
jgi:hypothetical protein